MKHQRARAPMAARSERLTARARWPIAAAGASAGKCTPATEVSTLTASRRPGVGASSAQSSPTPSATPASGPGGAGVK